MPEQLSKYPDVTLQVLKGAGAVCGEGAHQTILKQCPSERFCALPTGEICVYGIEDISQMTQITPQELAEAAGAAGMLDIDWLWLAAALVAGLILGRIARIPERRNHGP